ncbi:hypothetical protein LTR62_007528 [Meristemomyces frigidus]|uniref:Uncharacterized protein n=1 Tax=Meristemomyces frigidus TaxID=1508187 RepID=A0AAN7TBS3_9PEZI|nr:hypothetical protein LTR62_007528 [Meristemomyces frigidus]
MAPKKRITPSASQPEPVKVTRTSGRKRRHSDASNVSNATDDVRTAFSQGGSTVTQPKRRKKVSRVGATSVEPEVIVEEADEDTELSGHHKDTLLFGGDATVERERPSSSRSIGQSIDVYNSQTKHVSFGGIPENGGDASSAKKPTTPHPRKTASIGRRFTLSPAVGAGSQRRSTSLSRTSLPPGWNEDGLSQESGEVKYEMVPLREAVNDRVQRILRRSQLSETYTAGERAPLELGQAKKAERVRELELEMEEQRQSAIDDDDSQQRAMALEAELAEARSELRQHGTMHGLDLDGEMLVLNSKESVVYPDLLAKQSTGMVSTDSTRDTLGFSQREITTTTRTSLTAQMTEDWDAEREQFENAILALNKEANDARARLQILEIELGALSQEDGVDVLTAVKTIRQSHTNLRHALEDLFADEIPEHLSNQDVLELVIGKLRDQADLLREESARIGERDTLIADLEGQIEGLLQQLAADTIRRKTIEERWSQLDQDNEDKARTVEELEEELNESNLDRDSLLQQINEKQEEIRALSQDHAESLKSTEALQLSLEGYRTEEARLTELIIRMEKDHADTISKMAKEREETVADLENRLDEATELREGADIINSERQMLIAELEHKIADMTTEREALVHEVQTVTLERDTVMADREVAENALEEKTVEVESLEDRVTRLEEELEILTAQLEDLRKLNETERQQREAAEQELDDRNAELDTLDKRAQELGTEANELKGKLFGLQQDHAAEVTQLQQTMSDRDEQFQNDIADEVARREAADELAQQRAGTILVLETRVEEVELQARADEAALTKRIAEMNHDMEGDEKEIADLKLDLQSAENNHDVEKGRLEDRIEELENSVAVLQETIGEHEATILQLQNDSATTIDLHNSEIEDRNAEIADLHASLTVLRGEKEDLEQANSGLERRVEQEAEAMLDLQNAKEDEIDSYKSQLNDKQEKILAVERKAREADAAWQDILTAREEEIDGLKMSAASREEVTTELTSDFEAFRSRFREVIARQNSVIDKLQDAVDAAKVIADADGEALKREGMQALEEVEGFDFVGRLTVTEKRSVVSTSQQVSSQAQAGAGAKKGGKKGRRVLDSGIGLEQAEM